MYTDEEIAHGISMQTAAAFADWEGTKINLLDTPGYLDFTGEAISATRIADGAVVALGATTGVEVGTEKVWEYSAARGIPRLFFISMMDKEHASFEKVVDEIKQHLTPKAYVPPSCRSAKARSSRASSTCSPAGAHLQERHCNRRV